MSEQLEHQERNGRDGAIPVRSAQRRPVDKAAHSIPDAHVMRLDLLQRIAHGAKKLPPLWRTKTRIALQMAIDAKRRTQRKAQRRARRITRLHRIQ